MSNNKKTTSRRKFLVRSAVGVGVIIGTGWIGCGPLRRFAAEKIEEADAPYMGNTDTPAIWFEITEDNNIILHSPKVEMGQGTFTGMAQLAADELNVNMSQIQVVHAASDTGNIDKFATGGSTSISSLWVPLRELAATMRVMVTNEAAKIWGVSAATLTVADGIISGNGKSMTYGEVVKNVTEWKVPDVPPLKDIKNYKFIGKPIPRVDLNDKVFGAPIFGMDATLPGMLFGAVVRPDGIGSTFVSADISAAEGMPGVVKIVTEKDFVGVVATSRMEAENAKNAIKVDWKTDRDWNSADIKEMIKVGKGKPVVIQKQGDAKDILEGENIISAEYKSPIGAHAQLEPNGALVSVEGENVTVYISTQVVAYTRSEVADRLGLKKEKVNIIPTFLGGGFGRRLHTPNAVQAAVLSKAVGKPVKCFFNRKEEFQNDTFRPPTHHVLKAKLTADGSIEAIEHNVSSGDVAFGSAIVPGIAAPVLGADLGAWRGGRFQYQDIPNLRAVSWRVELPFATSWWRGLGLLANTFAIESFFDELAIQGGKDPVQLRLDHIQNDKRGNRLRAVIEKAAAAGNWQNELLPNGNALGFAASTDTNTPCAQVVEVSVKDNKIKVHKVTCVMDAGIIVNPDQVRAQCEGSIIMGMSAALYEKMEVVDGALQPTIYGPYQMALMRDAPQEINVILLEGDDKPGAVGEPPMGPIAAAIANAAFRITGKRMREMPLQV